MMRLELFGALGAAAMAAMVLSGCTQEKQTQLGREIQNWTGTNGVMEIYDQLMNEKVLDFLQEKAKIEDVAASEAASPS